ncbi:MAG: alpha/beta fold hydrolase [Bacteroidota bacterium]
MFFLVLALAFVGFTYYLSGMIIHGPPRRSIPQSFLDMEEEWNINRDSMLALLPEPEEVNFTGAILPSQQPNEAPNMRGWYFTFTPDSLSPPCAVLFAHGFTDNRTGMLKYTGNYKDCGCDLMLYDHRAHCQSGEDDLVYGGVLEAQDFLLAHQFLQEKTGLPDSKIAWVGESWGAGTVLLAAAENKFSPAFIAADSPYSDWYTAVSERAIKMFGGWIKVFLPTTFQWVGFRLGINHNNASPEKAAQKIQVPLFLAHSAADVETSPDQSRKIYDQLAHPEKTQLHMLPWGTWHVQAAAKRPLEYQALVESFIDEFAPSFCPAAIDNVRMEEMELLEVEN